MSLVHGKPATTAMKIARGTAEVGDVPGWRQTPDEAPRMDLLLTAALLRHAEIAAQRNTSVMTPYYYGHMLQKLLNAETPAGIKANALIAALEAGRLPDAELPPSTCAIAAPRKLFEIPILKR